MNKRVMTINLRPNIPNLLLLVKPNHFGFNEETAASNHFQTKRNLRDTTSKVDLEFEHVLHTLQENNIDFKVFSDGTEVLPDAVFPNNWISTSPNGDVTLYPMYAPVRQKEVRQDIVDWVFERVKGQTIIDLTFEQDNNRFLEGTGSMIFDHFCKKVYACESARTNIALFESYCQQINYAPISFESLDLNGNQIYHTNVMMSLAEKYCLINLDSIQNQLEKSFCKVSLENSDRLIIPISYAQMNCFAGNVLEVLNKIGESCLIMSETAYQSLNLGQIEAIENYSKIVQVQVPTIEAIGGGGIRCMLAGLFV